MAYNTLTFTAVDPSWVTGQAITVDLLRDHSEPEDKGDVDMPVIGLGKQVSYIGPGTQILRYMVRINKTSQSLYQTARDQLFALSRSVGTLVITPATSGQESSINALSETDVKLQTIEYASPMRDGPGKHSRLFNLTFEIMVLVEVTD